MIRNLKKFFRNVKRLSKKYGCLLVFDEVVTGFRVDLKGAQHYYKVTEYFVFGKAVAMECQYPQLLVKEK